MAHRHMPGRWYTGCGRNGATISSTSGLMNLQALTAVFDPFVIEQFGVDQISTGTAGATFLLSLYIGDLFGLPTDLVGTYGPLPLDVGTGMKTVLAMAEIPPMVSLYASLLTTSTSGSFRGIEAGQCSKGLLLPMSAVSTTDLNWAVDGLKSTLGLVGLTPPSRLEHRQITQSTQEIRFSYKVAA